MTAARWIRWSSVAAVVVVAAVAGWVSYMHALEVVRSVGEHGNIAYAYPVTVDGLIYCASMVLLDAARRKVTAPPLARWLLAAGIAATLFANVYSGLSYGPLGAAVAAWPAAALVGSYELLMLIVRAGAGTPATAVPGAVVTVPADPPPPSADADLERLIAWLTTGQEPVPAVPASVPEHGAAAAELFASDLIRAQVPGIRAIRKGLHIGQDKATQVQVYLRTLTPSLNGQARHG